MNPFSFRRLLGTKRSRPQPIVHRREPLRFESLEHRLALSAVSLPADAVVWYVDASRATHGDGSFANPFKYLTSLNGVGGAGDVDGPGDAVFLFDGDYKTGNDTAGLVLERGQQWIGEGVELIVGGTTVVPGGPAARPRIHSQGTGITLADDNVVRGLSVVNAGIVGSGIAGGRFDDLTLTGGRIALTNTTGSLHFGANTQLNNAPFVVNGGNADITFAGTISTAYSAVVSITGMTGGSVSFNGPIHSNRGGIVVRNTDTGNVTFSGKVTLHTGANDAVKLERTGVDTRVEFSGGLDLATTTGTALSVEGTVGTIAGTLFGTFVRVAGSSNALTSSSGSALSLKNAHVDITLAGVTSNGSATSGILLEDLIGGNVNVTGTAKVSNSASAAIDVVDSRIGVQIGSVDIDNAQGDGIRFLGGSRWFGDLAVNGGSIDGVAGDGIRAGTDGLAVRGVSFGASSPLQGSGITFLNEDLTGRVFSWNRTLTVQNSHFSNVLGRGVQVFSTSSETVIAGVRDNTFLTAGDGFHSTHDGDAQAIRLSLDRNRFETTGTGSAAVRVTSSAAVGSSIVHSLLSNTVLGNGVGGGIALHGVTFDADLFANGLQFVPGGVTAIGQGPEPDRRVAGVGLQITESAGLVKFDSLLIASEGVSLIGAGHVEAPPAPYTPTVSDATAYSNVQTAGGLVIQGDGTTPAAAWYRITDITNGTLYRNDGTSAIAEGDFIAAADGLAGLRFTPEVGFVGQAGFNVQASLTNATGGLKGNIVDATITVNAGFTIIGTQVSQGVNDTGTRRPFSGVTINNWADPAALLTVQVSSDSPASGALSGDFAPQGGAYTFTGTAAQATAALRGLVFTPTLNRIPANQSRTIRFEISANDGRGPALTNSGTSVIVYSVNDAPALLGEGFLPPVVKNSANPAGATVASIFSSATFLDADAYSSLNGVAVIANPATAAEGAWQYSTNGTSWFAVGAVNDQGSALLLSAATRLRFLPAPDFQGPVTALVVRALDDTHTFFSSTNGGTQVRRILNTAYNGGTSPVAAATNAIHTTILPQVGSPVVAGSPVTTTEATPSSPVVIGRGVDEDALATHFRITGLRNGTLFLAGNGAPVGEGDFITYADAQAGLRFLPAGNLASPANVFSFNVQASLTGDVSGLGGNVVAVPILVTDTTAPAAMLLSVPAELTRGTGATFTFTGSDNGTASEGLAFEASLDGAPFTAVVSGVSYSALADGGHTFELRARDAAGNVGEVVRHAWTVDSLAPQTFIESSPPTLHSSTGAHFAFSGTDEGGVAGFEYQVDGGQWVATSATNLTLEGLSEGSHSFAVRAVDAAGNRDTTPASFAWTVDSVAPSVALAAVSPNPRMSSVFALDLTFSEAVDGFDLADLLLTRDGATVPLDGARLDSADGRTWTLAGLNAPTSAEGDYRLRVKSAGSAIRDAAGNLLAADAQLSWRHLTASDDFGRADSTALGGDWAENHGNLSTIGGALKVISVTGIAAHQSDPVADVAVEGSFDLAKTGTQYGGLLARYGGSGDRNHFWGALVGVDGKFTAEIWRNEGGKLLLLSRRPVAAGTGTLRFEVVGNSLRLFLNGAVVGYAFDNALPNPGKVGFRGNTNAAVDDFLAEAVTRAPQSLPLQEGFDLPDGAQLDQALWQRHFGNVTVVGGRAVGDAGLNMATSYGVSAGDVSLSLDLALSSRTGTEYAGLVARYGGPGNDTNMYWGALINVRGTYYAEIWRQWGGQWVKLVSNQVATGTGTISFVAHGTSLRLSLNGRLAAAAQDDRLMTGGVGFRSYLGTAFDNFRAEASTAPPPAGFVDNFTAPNGSPLWPSWSAKAGGYTVQGERAVGTASANLAVLAGPPLADSSTELRLALPAVGVHFAGLAARHGGGDDLYWGSLEAVNGTYYAVIWKNVGGAWTLLSRQGVSKGAGVLRFDVTGTSLSLYLDGDLVGGATDGDLTSGGVGVRGYKGTAVDDFRLLS